MTISLIGVYQVKESELPCYLIEAKVSGYSGPLDFGKFTQAVEGQPSDNWQVPWDEYLLDEKGTSGKLAWPGPILIHGDQRIAFFIYLLDLSLPMITPFGEVELLNTSPRPDRLGFIKYESPE